MRPDHDDGDSPDDHGASDPGAIDAAGFDGAIGTKAIEQAQSGLVADMDRLADAIYGRE